MSHINRHRTGTHIHRERVVLRVGVRHSFGTLSEIRILSSRIEADADVGVLGRVAFDLTAVELTSALRECVATEIESLRSILRECPLEREHGEDERECHPAGGGEVEHDWGWVLAVALGVGYG